MTAESKTASDNDENSAADKEHRADRKNDDDESDEEDDEHRKDFGAEAAGVVRGVSRSIGRSLARSPIGRLPQSIPTAIKPSTARQIARMTDRVSSGLTWYGAYEESSQAAVAPKPRPWLRQAKAFAMSLARHSVLGTLVFETYGKVVTSYTSGKDPDEVDLLDEYARAPVPLHYVAGFAAGGVQGALVSSPAMWEAAKAYRNAGLLASPLHTPSYATRFVSLNTLNHSLAQSLLFGSYQGTKRLFENALLDDSSPSFGIGYLFCFSMAGGFAGQIQHVFSHYSEQVFGLSENEMRVAPSMMFRGFIHPSLRSTMMAFPSSAIGFLAFEYGKKFL
ncbi:hypothetical protein MPSEU_000784500 [Mayamaea pseudoterrestris]|nr:hypothetical protein MPSEU_000784500 [Mayamaea pseudoterrestris]